MNFKETSYWNVQHSNCFILRELSDTVITFVIYSLINWFWFCQQKLTHYEANDFPKNSKKNQGGYKKMEVGVFTV